MGFIANLKGNQAHAAHVRGNFEKARELYDQAYAAGLDNPKTLLTYSVLLLRSQEYDKALEVLRKLEKLPNLPANFRTEMLTNYAIICYKKGKLDRGVSVLRDLFRKNKTATIYGAYSYLLVEWAAMQKDAPVKAEAATVLVPEEGAEEEQAQVLTPEQEAKKICEAALDYDEEDPVFLDNLGQYYYRVEGDKEKALGYFEKAIEFKPAAIDTNYFLALYDIERGDKEKAKEKLEKSLEGRFSPLNYATKELIEAKLAELGAAK